MNREQFKEAFREAKFQNRSGTSNLSFTIPTDMLIYGCTVSNLDTDTSTYRALLDGNIIFECTLAVGDTFNIDFAGRGIRTTTSFVINRVGGTGDSSATITWNMA